MAPLPQPRRRLSPIVPNRCILRTLMALPAKSILRFKCVSRAWFDLISHPNVQDRYYAIKASSSIPRRFLFQSSDFDYDPRSNTAFHRFLTLNSEGLQLDDFSISVVGGPIKLLLPSYRGLICFANDTSVYLCNPTTHSYIQLPPLRRRDTISGFGFGYVESTGEYKVAGLVHKARQGYYLPCKLECSVFTYPTVTNTTWKVLPVSCPCFVNEFSLPVFLSLTESIYWKIDHNHRHCQCNSRARGDDFLVYLDIKAERFGVIGRPQGWNPIPGSPPTLKEAGGKLSMIQMVQYPLQNPDFPVGLLVWVLTDQQNSQWIKQQLILAPIDNTTILGEVKHYQQGQPIIFSSPNEVIIYSNPKNMRYRKVPIPEGLRNMDFCIYTENLLTLRLPLKTIFDKEFQNVKF